MSSVHFSSTRNDWETPAAFFAEVSRDYGPFNLDVCATTENAKCNIFLTPEQDGLKMLWFGVCWMNPPYGREISKWMGKAVKEAVEGNVVRVVCLVPARTDTAWWHDFVVPYGRVKFLRGRLKFEGAKNCAPFPSALVIFEGWKRI